MASEETSSLDPTSPNQFGRGKREKRKRKEKKEGKIFRERESTFSLGFSTIGPSNLGKTRGKVDPHCNSYEWVPVLWSFNKLQEVGVLLLLWLFLA